MQVLVFLIILSVVVLIHEGGHFGAARFFGIRVDEFGFGFPPRLIKLFKRGDTEYTINWLPIGGFVRIYGENGEGEGIKDSRAFWAKPVWQRAVVLVAGVVMNFLLGVVLFGTVYSILGIPTKTDEVRVLEVEEGSPAQIGGLEGGMVIKALEVNGEVVEFKESSLFIGALKDNLGAEVGLIVETGGVEEEIGVTLRANPRENEGALGALVTDVELRKYPWWQMPFRGGWVGLQEAIAWGKEIVVGLVLMVVGLVTGKGLPGDVAGVVGIYQVSNQAREAGVLALLQFVGILSINLAILNLMPLPALDGGRLVLLGLEKIRGKKLHENIEGWINMTGMVFILGLMVVITANDIARVLGGWGSILGRFGF